MYIVDRCVLFRASALGEICCRAVRSLGVLVSVVFVSFYRYLVLSASSLFIVRRWPKQGTSVSYRETAKAGYGVLWYGNVTCAGPAKPSPFFLHPGAASERGRERHTRRERERETEISRQRKPSAPRRQQTSPRLYDCCDPRCWP